MIAVMGSPALFANAAILSPVLTLTRMLVVFGFMAMLQTLRLRLQETLRRRGHYRSMNGNCE